MMKHLSTVCYSAVCMSLLCGDPSQLQAQSLDSKAASTAPSKNFALEGICIDGQGAPLKGVEIELLRSSGLTSPIESLANTSSDSDGRFRFADLPARSIHAEWEHSYHVLARSAGRTSAMRVVSTDAPLPKEIELKFLDKPARVSGRITGSDGRPVARAIVAHLVIGSQPCAAVMAAETDGQGRYVIDDLVPIGKPAEDGGRPGLVPTGRVFRVYHPDYPITRFISGTETSSVIDVALETGGTVEGRVIDATSGGPAVGVSVIARRTKTQGDILATTGADGRYRLRLLPDRYVIRAVCDDRVCIPNLDFEVRNGKNEIAPDLQMIAGAMIRGRVQNKASESPAAVVNGRALAITLRGPAYPVPNGARGFTRVQPDGTFQIRAAPGSNQITVSGGSVEASILPSSSIDVKEGEEVNLTVSVSIPQS